MYKLFAGDNYYPLGGYQDFYGSFETLEAAKAALDRRCDWAHIVFEDQIVWHLGMGL